MANYQYGRFSRSRVETFSDGVFAIIVTLLVLEIKLPDLHQASNLQIADAILAMLPKIIIWMNSFLIVCVIWLNHQRLMETFDGIDAGVFWLNNLLLMFSSLIPFPTALVGQYSNSPAALCFYGICMALCAFGFYLLRLYMVKNPDLLKKEVVVESFKRGTKASLLFGPTLYLGGAAISWINIWAAFIIYFFIPLYFISRKAIQTV